MEIQDVLIFFGFVFIGVVIVMIPILTLFAVDEIKDYFHNKKVCREQNELIKRVNSADIMPLTTPLLQLFTQLKLKK